MENNTSIYSATLDALKSIKHINNLMMISRNERYVSTISLLESKETIMHILHFLSVKVWEDINSIDTWEKEQNRIDFYINLYELAEKGRLEIFTKKGGE